MVEKKKDEMFSEEKKKEKEIVKKEETAVGQPLERATGTENISGDDVQLPRLRLIQATSAEAEEGAVKPGTIKHTLTENEYEKMEVILITMSKNRIMFDPENRRGGPICRSLELKEGSGCECGCNGVCAKCTYSKGFPSQCNLVYNYPCVLVDDVGKEMIPTLMSFMKSSVPAAQKINASVIGKVPPQPFWNNIWEISTTKKDYKKGRSAFVYTVTSSRETTEDERQWATMIYNTYFKDKALAQQRMAAEFETSEDT